MNRPPRIQACLNGRRTRDEHPAVPLNPAELARDAAAAVHAGAASVHIHPRDAAGRETLDGDAVAEVIAAVRVGLAGLDVPVGVTTGAWILSDPAKRLGTIGRWTQWPDFASVNLHEPGALAIADLLIAHHVGVEAGVWSPSAADALQASGLGGHMTRILIEPTQGAPAVARTAVSEIEARLAGIAEGVPRLLHGFDATAWPMLDLAMARDYELRCGLEDTLLLPDGSTARSNAEIVTAARSRT